MSRKILCAAAERCETKRQTGKIAELSSGNTRHQLSIETGYCAKCRAAHPNPSSLPHIQEFLDAITTKKPRHRGEAIGGGVELTQEISDEDFNILKAVEESAKDFSPDKGPYTIYDPADKIRRDIEKMNAISNISYNNDSLAKIKALTKANQEAEDSVDSDEGGDIKLPHLSGETQNALLLLATDGESPLDVAKRISMEARTTSVLDADLVDAIYIVDKVLENSASFNEAVFATSLAMNEVLVVVDSKKDHSAALVMGTAQTLGFETRLLTMPKVDSGTDESQSFINDIESQITFALKNPDSKSALMISGLAKSTPQLKSIVADMVANMRFGELPIPKNVRIVLMESGGFTPADIPKEVNIKSVFVPGIARVDSALDEIQSATAVRAKMLQAQLEKAQNSGDKAREATIRGLLEKAGYMGAHSEHYVQGAAGGAADNSVVLKINDLVKASGRTNREARASFIFDVVQPEKGDLRQDVARALLTGVGGEEFADNAIRNYMSKNAGVFSKKPTVGEVVLGQKPLKEMASSIKKDKEYAKALAFDIRRGSAAKSALATGGDHKHKVLEILMAIGENHPDVFEALMEDQDINKHI